MPAGRVVVGLPELRRLAEGKPLMIRIRPGTTELEISLSLIARGFIAQKSQPDPVQAIADLIRQLGRR